MPRDPWLVLGGLLAVLTGVGGLLAVGLVLGWAPVAALALVTLVALVAEPRR